MLLALALLVCSCADRAESSPENSGQKLDSDDPLYECVALRDRDVQSIQEAVALINQLPKPADVPCFVAALQRPLSVVATNSTLSAQPAAGPDDPRVFILSEGLVMSVVSDGDGANLLELGQWVSEERTIKGEIAFPIDAAIPESEPFDELMFSDSMTKCAFCHRNESEHPTIAGAFVSEALQIDYGKEVLLEDLLSIYANCDPDKETQRCERLRALLDTGEVRQGAFDEQVPRFLTP